MEENRKNQKMSAIAYFRVTGVHWTHKKYVNKNYPLTDLRTMKAWEKEFKKIKIID